jgi:integrase/recombinase XerC
VGSAHTFEAAVYDLADALRYIDRRKCTWDDINDDFIVGYGRALLDVVSTQTHEELGFETAMRRVARLLDYALWRKSKKLPIGVATFNLRFFRKEISASHEKTESFSRERGSAEHDELARGLSAGTAAGYSCDPSNVLELHQWQQLKAELGRSADEQSAGDTRPTRDRIAAWLAVYSGLRVDEIAKLSIYQILDIRVDDTMPDDLTVNLRVTKTKRLRPRTVLLPVKLVRELHTYIKTERKECIAEARKNWLHDNMRAPTVLFLNGVDSRQHAGKAVTTNTLSARFHEAVLRCGFRKTVEKIDPADGSEYTTKVASFTFHSLRHTFAVWMYYSLIDAEVADPWKTVQVLLGHKYLSTTIHIYLRCVRLERRRINIGTFRGLRSRFGGD